MKKVAKFEKVSYAQFRKDFIEMNDFNSLLCEAGIIDKYLTDIYGNIKMPRRATAGSNGYDFYMPFDLHLRPYGCSPCRDFEYAIPTGIRCEMADGWGLFLLPRSGLGSKYGFRFVNTIGDIDSDYCGAENEGHIKAVVRVDKHLDLKAGQAYMQGVFLPFGITVDDDADGARTGGYGSTG